MTTAPNEAVMLAKRLAYLRGLKGWIEDWLSDVNKSIEEIAKRQLPKIMEDAEIEKFSLVGVGTVYTRTEVLANIKAEDRSAVYAELAQQGHGDIVVDYIHPKTLTSFVKEQLEKGETVPEKINYTFQQVATIRRS